MSLKDYIDEKRYVWLGCDWHTKFGEFELDLKGLTAEEASARAMKAAAARDWWLEFVWYKACLWLREVEKDAARATTLAILAARQCDLGYYEYAAILAENIQQLEDKYKKGVPDAIRIWKNLLRKVHDIAFENNVKVHYPNIDKIPS